MILEFDERTLPQNLQEDIENWVKYRNDELNWDIYADFLSAAINRYQYDYVISKEIADYLRKKYLNG